MATYTKPQTIDASLGGDTVKQAILDCDDNVNYLVTAANEISAAFEAADTQLAATDAQLATADTQLAAVDADLQAQITALVPTGTIIHHLQWSVVGYLRLVGESFGNINSTATHKSADYAALFDLVKSLNLAVNAPHTQSFAAGDSLFLPNLGGRVIVGAGSGSGLTHRSLAVMGGNETHQLTLAEMAAHTHEKGTLITSNINHSHTVSNSRTGLTNVQLGGDVRVIGTGSQFPTDSGTSVNSHDHSISGSTAPTGSNGAHNNMQPYMAMFAHIKW